MDELLRAWFVQHGVEITVQHNGTSLVLLGNEIMTDPGFATGTAIIEIQIEEETKVIFIGSLRLPRRLRGMGMGREITNIIKTYTSQHGYTLFLDACENCDLFWTKQGFTLIHKDVYGLKIMGFPGARSDLLPQWQAFSKTAVCKEQLLFHINN